MKKLITILFLLGLSFNFQHSVAEAKSVKKSKSSQKKMSLAYEKVWFANLSSKKQALYLKTMEKLTLKLTRSGVASLESSYLKFFIDQAEAANRINNGFIFDGANDAADYDAFLESLNLGVVDPGCTPPEQACAPYTGMICGGGQAKLACSNDSTPTCVSRGSRDCLQGTLAGCASSSTEYCTTLNRVMRRGTQGVNAYCTAGSRVGLNFCKQALAALNNGDVPLPPNADNPPTGADCEEMTRRLAEAKDNNRSAELGAEETGASNNNFWRNMTGFAQQACGHQTVTSTTNIVGICNVQNMAPDGNLTSSSVQTFTKDSDADGFQSCLDAKISAASSRTVRANIRNVYSRSGAECTMTVTAPITDSSGNSVNQELELSELMSLAGKIRTGTRLGETDENKFRAATGMTSVQFQRTFCNSGNHENFKRNLRQTTIVPTNIIGEGSIANLFRGQAAVARAKVARCLSNLKSQEDTGCRIYTINDSNMLRCASSSQPILAYNKQSRKCSLVVGFDRRTTGNVNGSPTRATTLTIRTPNSEQEQNIRSESFFARDHELKTYRCDGDRAENRSCYMVPPADDPAQAGEAEAREVEL